MENNLRARIFASVLLDLKKPPITNEKNRSIRLIQRYTNGLSSKDELALIKSLYPHLQEKINNILLQFSPNPIDKLSLKDKK